MTLPRRWATQMTALKVTGFPAFGIDELAAGA
jgi:hypothetical protein